MDFFDILVDAELHIDTIGRDERHSTDHIHPYEPTSYSVLERLTGDGHITSADHLLDYGSGKGRVPIYMHDRTGCRATGIEVVNEFYEASLMNLKKYDPEGRCGDALSFIYAKAQDHEISGSVNRIFFFNPFSISIMRSVFDRIIESYQRAPREIRMFFYYPHGEYVAFLMGRKEVMFEDEIDCTDLFYEKDDRNRIMIFEIT